MYVCMYNFYLHKLFKLSILLKEIIMIINTHTKLILNMYNLFYRFYCRERERERTCDGEQKNTTPKRMNPKQSLKITLIHQYKVELQEIIKNQEKENNHFFKRECEKE